MLIVPALDLRGGKVVRLYRGCLDRATVYSSDPVEEARRWVEAGARRLHLVDLDGAACGYPVQLDLVARVIRAVDVPLQVGGGLRSEAQVARVLEAGAQWAILGSAAARDPDLVGRCLERWPDRIMVSLDLRGGRVALDAWQKTAAMDGVALARFWGERGLRDLIVTDADRDGTLAGVDPALWEPFLGGPWRLWAAGGVAGEEDLRRLAALAPRGLAGVIVGRAIYAGVLDLRRTDLVSRANDTGKGTDGAGNRDDAGTTDGVRGVGRCWHGG